MADVLREYESKIDAIQGLSLGRTKGSWSVSITTESDDPKLAVREMRRMQSELRALKKKANLRMKMLRNEYRQVIADQGYKLGVGGALLGSRYRGAMRREASEKKRKLRAQRDEALAPYEQVKTGIDQLVLELDRMKIELQF